MSNLDYVNVYPTVGAGPSVAEVIELMRQAVCATKMFDRANDVKELITGDDRTSLKVYEFEGEIVTDVYYGGDEDIRRAIARYLYQYVVRHTDWNVVLEFGAAIGIIASRITTDIQTDSLPGCDAGWPATYLSNEEWRVLGNVDYVNVYPVVGAGPSVAEVIDVMTQASGATELILGKVLITDDKRTSLSVYEFDGGIVTDVCYHGVVADRRAISQRIYAYIVEHTNWNVELTSDDAVGLLASRTTTDPN